MKRILISALVFLFAFNLVACSTNSQQQNTGVGVVTGAVAGGLLGSLVGGGVGQIVAIGAGAILGGVVGGNVGHSMDSSDTTHVDSALTNNTTNQPTYWRNTHTGATYRVVPTSRPMAMKGYQYCRKFRTTAVINGHTRYVHGVACRQNNGSWVAVGH